MAYMLEPNEFRRKLERKKNQCQPMDPYEGEITRLARHAERKLFIKSGEFNPFAYDSDSCDDLWALLHDRLTKGNLTVTVVGGPSVAYDPMRGNSFVDNFLTYHFHNKCLRLYHSAERQDLHGWASESEVVFQGPHSFLQPSAKYYWLRREDDPSPISILQRELKKQLDERPSILTRICDENQFRGLFHSVDLPVLQP